MIFTSVRSTIFDTNPSSKKTEFILSKDCIATTAVSTTMEKTHWKTDKWHICETHLKTNKIK